MKTFIHFNKYSFQVLQVIVNKDQRGRKTVEYLIHFQVT